MNDFSNRQNLILQILSQSTDFITSANLTNEFHITRRTLINDIKAINSSYPLIISNNRGYKINPIYLNFINDILISNENFYESDNEIIKFLLIRENGAHVDEIIQTFYISSSVLNKILLDIKKKLNYYDLNVAKEKGIVSIKGEETQKRDLMAYIIHHESLNLFSDIDNFKSYFPNINISDISEDILQIINNYEYTVPKYYEMNFLINVMVIISRNSFIISNTIEENHIIDSNCTNQIISNEIIKLLNKKYHMHYVDKTTVAKELEYALFGFVQPIGEDYTTPKIDKLSDNFIKSIRQIVEEVFQYYYLTTVDYASFISLFCLHVSELIKRCIYSKNCAPSNISLKQNSPYIYEIAVSISDKIGSLFNIIVPDSEINFIAIHIGYAVQQATSQSDVAPIIIISDFYHDNCKIIADRLVSKMYNSVQIVGFYHSFDEISYNSSKNCLIISSIQSTHSVNNVCYISPLFTENDFIKIQQSVLDFIKEKTRNDVTSLIRNYSSDDCFFVCNDDMDKYEAISYLVEKARANNDVNDDFLQQVIKRERLSSTGFFGKFAVPHSNKQNANATKLYFLINNQGILWDERKIRFVCLIIVKRQANDNFMKLYNGLTDTLYKSNSFFHNLNMITNIEDLIKYLFQ